MAVRMIPARGSTCFGLNLAEREVYEALEAQLPDGSYVVYDYQYAVIQNNSFIDGQVDFIAVVPGVGICFIEVKGSKRFEYRDARWHRYEGNHAVAVDDPFDQAMKNKHRVVQITKERLGWTSFPARYGYLVVYPRGELVGEVMPMAHPRMLLVTRREIKGLGDRAVEVIRKSGDMVSVFWGKTVESFIEALTTGGALVPVVAADLDAERSGIEALTAEQYRTWQSLLTYNRVVVVGPAGSGKTVLAVAKAKHLWQQSGGRVLLTCFNKRLAEWIRLGEELDTPWQREGEPGLAPGIHVCHFHDLASKYIVKVAGRGEDWNRLSRKKGEEAFFREIVPVLLDEATDQLGDEWRFDAVVIDEGQDFENLWLSKVQLLLKNRDNGAVMLCLGDGQRLFTADQQYISNVDAFHTLKHNCRNSKRIGAYAVQAGGVPSQPLAGSPEGEPPVLMPSLPAPEDRGKAVARLVQDWLDEGVPRSSIAVLSSMGETNNYGSVPTLKQALKQPTTSDVRQWKSGEAIWVSTIRAFKGMEADGVILVDIPQSGGPNFSRDDLYVAVSRPRSRLVIVPSTNEAYKELAAYSMQSRR